MNVVLKCILKQNLSCSHCFQELMIKQIASCSNGQSSQMVKNTKQGCVWSTVTLSIEGLEPVIFFLLHF